MFPVNNNEGLTPQPKRGPSQKKQLESLSDTTDTLVYGSASSSLKSRNDEIQKLVNKTLKTTLENQFGNTSKPLEYFSLNMINDLYSKIAPKKGSKRQSFEEVISNYAQAGGTADPALSRIKYNNYRNIYSHIPAAHVALNIYKSSILSPETLSDSPINFSYKTNDEVIQSIMETRIKTRIIEKYDLNNVMDNIVKEALIDGISYKAVISIEKDMQQLLKNNNLLTEEAKLLADDNYFNDKIKFMDSEVTSEQTEAFNNAIHETAMGFINVTNKYIEKTKKSNDSHSSSNKLLAESYIASMENFVNKDEKLGYSKKDFTGVQIGRYVRDLINDNVVIKSKYDFMEDYQAALNEGFNIDEVQLDEAGNEILRESYNEEGFLKKDRLYLNGSKIITLEPSRVTPLKIGEQVIGYLYAERDISSPAEPTSVNAGAGGAAGVTQGAPVSFGINTYGTGGLGGGTSGLSGYGNNTVNPISAFGTEQVKNNHIVDLFVNGLGKKLNKNFIKNNKDLKELIHELLREKYITQKKINITFFSSDDVIETRVKPLFEGSEYSAKLYLAELTNNITISMGRGMDRRLIRIPFGLDEDMGQTVQDAIRAFKTQEFSMSSIDDTSISNLIRLSPGRYEDMYVPVSSDGRAGYEIDILPGQDNSKSMELLPILRAQFLDSINIPASAIDSIAETDFSRTIAMRNVHFSKEIVDYQKFFNKTITQLIIKIYTDEYRYIGNKVNNEQRVNLDAFQASFSKPSSIDIQTTLETIQNVELYANHIVSVVVNPEDENSAAAAFELKKKIFKDEMPYLNIGEYEKFVKEIKTDNTVAKIKRSGKKGSSLDNNDPNSFNGF